MKRQISEAAKAFAEEATKIALNKAAQKKLETQGTYTKKLKDTDMVTINPDKPDAIASTRG
jgi:hypothetical protein